MIHYRLFAKGGIPTAIWASAAIYVLFIFLYAVFSLPASVFLLALAGSTGCFILFPWQAKLTRVTISGTEVRVSSGGVFVTTRRLPRGRINGCSLFSTPVQRLFGVACLTLHTPGMSVLLLGIDQASGYAIASLLEGGETDG